jgi:Domain of unknown function (DUF6946)
MSRILIPSDGPECWRRFLADPEKHWRDGYSAKETAYNWEAADGLPAEIARMFASSPELLIAIPEHKVPMPGRGADSQCDVFALARSGAQLCALSVEAKVAESFDVTVGQWLAKGGQNRRARVKGICELLEIDGAPDELRYQLLHRTAAAVIEARRFKADQAIMVVQSFSPEHMWHDDFAAFCAHVGVGSERGHLHYKSLADGLPLGLAWVSAEVRGDK